MRLIALLFLFFFFIFPSPIFAQGDYLIEKFNSQISVLDNGEIIVNEKINVNFLEEKHGIFRDLPFVYQDASGKKTYTEISVDKVLQDNITAKTDVSKNENNLRIKIGDANKTITGIHTYEIVYKVNGVITSQKGFDELYWNVTGNNWDTQISSAEATISTGRDAIEAAACYEGAEFSTQKCTSSILDPKRTVFSTTRQLSNYEGMTIATGFKKGIYPIISVERPKTFFDRLLSTPSVALFLSVILVGFLFLIKQWSKYGRDSWFGGIAGYTSKDQIERIKPLGAHEPTVVEFTPPEKLTPALIGVIVDERADTLDVTATIIDLASRGFLTISEIPKSWIFGKTDYLLSETGKDHTKLMNYEKELLKRLFTKKEIKISELKTKFYDDLAKVKEKLYEEVVAQKLFPHHPNKIRNNYLLAGVVIFFFSIFVVFNSAAVEWEYVTSLFSATAILGILTMITSRAMSRRTAYGREIYRRIKGYRMFIDRAESYKQKFFENKNTFTDVLPYTIVFGLTQKFANAMKDIGLQPNNPSWYHGAHAFNLGTFSSGVSDFSSSLSSAIASTPHSSGSGGGGFSGGGFGGGGGGSW